jgi:phosphoglycerate dehydrogenase-like enzyme
MKTARCTARGENASARPAEARFRADASTLELPVHLHVETNRDLGQVFQATPKRIEEALARHPRLAGKVRVTIGYDGDIYLRAMRTADALFGWRFDREDLANKAPRLRWIHAHGAGINHLIPLDWLPPGAVLTNSRGVHGEKADEYTLMAILMLNNQMPRIMNNQRRAIWEQPFNSSVAGKTLLIVGVGHVGGGAAKWAKRFGMQVIGIRRTGRPHRNVDEMHVPAALPKLLRRADFVLITTPHTKDTHHLIGRRELDLMKPGAGLINYSRAQLVDYAALAPKLRKGELSAILDVFDPEPLPRSSQIWKLPNLIITPHCSSDDIERYTPKTLELICRNLERLIDGKRLLNRVSPLYQY